MATISGQTCAVVCRASHNMRASGKSIHGLYQPETMNLSRESDFWFSIGNQLLLALIIQAEGISMQTAGKPAISRMLACTMFLASDPAHALRCGSLLVKEGMHQSEVKAICGQPISERSLGYVVRNHGFPTGRHFEYAGYHRELLVTELLFNFGPRKLMRKMRFEGGLLTSIETIGYGYREKRKLSNAGHS
jgi:hypothetical protein